MPNFDFAFYIVISLINVTTNANILLVYHISRNKIVDYSTYLILCILSHCCRPLRLPIYPLASTYPRSVHSASLLSLWLFLIFYPQKTYPPKELSLKKNNRLDSNFLLASVIASTEGFLYNPLDPDSPCMLSHILKTERLFLSWVYL